MYLANAALAATTLFALTLLAPDAQARRVAIDSVPLNPFTPCVIGTPCAPLPLGFTANFGNGSFSGLYVYNNGLVSFGSEIPVGADLSSLASIGIDVFTAGYSPSMTLTNFVAGTGSANVDFPGRPVLRVLYNMSFGAVTDAPVQFSIYDIDGSDFAMFFDYGDASFGPDIANDAYIGYSFSGVGALQINTPQLVVQNADNDDFQYRFPLRTTSVPEPASFAVLLAGVTLLGGAMARRRPDAR
jgi:hypothetical protein